MHIVFNNDDRDSPEVSIILLDWSCRESFHIIDYLEKQTIPKTHYEVIWIEYFDRRAPQIEAALERSRLSGKPPIVDRWVVMNIPKNAYYHKHLMYNLGIILSRGKIVAICDSDAIVRETFVERIIGAFEFDSNIVLHLDQVRNNDRRFYPFNYPTVEDVIGGGCINWHNGKTTGLWDSEDILHTRNYGACMAARREDLVAIGGADEHMDYLGHVCGPYEMTFRLVNDGKREVWHSEEFLYHVWHPGQAGEKNYVGPHDGRHVSTRALRAKFTGRIIPFVENSALRKLRLGKPPPALEQILPLVVSEERLQSWSINNLPKLKSRLWRTLRSSRNSTAAVRLLCAFFKVLFRQARQKAMQLSTRNGKTSIQRLDANSVAQRKLFGRIVLSASKAWGFAKRTVEFCVYATERSRECLNTLAAGGNNEVSFYGTDEFAEILYALTFHTPVAVKNIYDDINGKKFHALKVLPVETCGSTQEKVIITSLVGVEDKIRRLKTYGVPADRIVILP